MLLALISPLSAVASPPPADLAPAVRVSADGSPCPARTHLAERTAALLAPHVESATSVDIQIESARPGFLVVTFRSGEQTLLRSIALTSHDCDELPMTIAEIARDWLRRQRQPPPPATAAATNPDPVPPPPSDALSRAPTAAPLEAPPADASPPHRWRLSASGGAFAAPPQRTAHVGFTVAASAEHDLTARWGLVALGGYDARVGKDLGDGSRASAALWTAGLLARLGLAGGPAASRLEALAGPALTIVDARLSAATFQDSARYLDPALVLMLRFRHPVTSLLELVSAAGVVSRGRGEDIHSRVFTGDSFLVPATRLELTVGVAAAL